MITLRLTPLSLFVVWGAGGFLFALNHRVHTEWQRPLSGVHSIMMGKLAQPGEGGGWVHVHPLSLYLLIVLLPENLRAHLQLSV